MTGIEGSQLFGPFGEKIASNHPPNYGSPYTPMTGFTGHLQTEPNGLVYMRGRFYSPVWHSFLAPDRGKDPNQLNQFAYCAGAPLANSDPSGNSLLGDLLDPLHVSSIVKNINNISSIWKDINKMAENALKIAVGPFRGNFEKIFLKNTWEHDKEATGLNIDETLNAFGQVDSVQYRDGATLVDLVSDTWIKKMRHEKGSSAAFTMGSFITAPYGTNTDSVLFCHEYGHYLQSRLIGPNYIPAVAFPSLVDTAILDNPNHSWVFFEKDASERSLKHFNVQISLADFIAMLDDYEKAYWPIIP